MISSSESSETTEGEMSEADILDDRKKDEEKKRNKKEPPILNEFLSVRVRFPSI